MGSRQWLALVLSIAQLEYLRDASLTLVLNMGTFRTHPRFTLVYIGNPVSLS